MKDNSFIGKAIRYTILIVFVVLVITVVRVECQTDEPQLLEIRNFQGLNTAAGDFQIQPNEAVTCNDIDLGRKLSSISKRYGYDSVRYVAVLDSIVDIYGAYYSDGSQQMFWVLDQSTAGHDYGSVHVTTKGSFATFTKIWSYFSVQNKPSFAMLDDNIYIVNGSHKGVVCNASGDDVIARPYPLQAPGEPLIVPTTKAGPLDGEYRYMFRAQAWPVISPPPSYLAFSNSVITSPVVVKNGQILLTRFQLVPSDTLGSAVDSLHIRIYRTKANPGALDLSDTVYYTGLYLRWTSGNISDDEIIDSISDANLHPTDKYALVEPGAWSGRDSTGIVGRRYGSPTFVSSYGGTGQDIFHGWPTNQTDTLGVAYICTFIDTATGIESDSGRALFVFCDSGNPSPSFDRVHLNLPKTIDTEDGIVVNLYRACIYQQGYDTSYWSEKTIREADDKLGFKSLKWIDEFIPETTVVLDYHLLGQFDVSQTDYWDQIPYDSLKNTRIYRKQTAPPLMSKIFSYENRLFGIQKSGLYFSAPVYADTLQSWGAMALTPINPDDGDMVTTAWPTRGVIRVMKSYSNYNVYQDANLDWSKTEVSGYFGCVAPNSHVAGLGGHYYLSAEGVIREIEGAQLERTQQVELISAKLDNFDQYDISELYDAQGFYFDRKYLLCIGDTTYVYDERADGWSTWEFKFTGATLFGTEDELRFLPGDSMYFLRPNEDNLYRYGTSEKDNGGSIDILWRSGPILVDHRYKSIVKTGTWKDATTSTADLRNNWYNEKDTYQTVAIFDSINVRYSVVSVVPKPCLYYEYTLHTVSAYIDEAFSVDGLDVWYRFTGEKLVE